MRVKEEIINLSWDVDSGESKNNVRSRSVSTNFQRQNYSGPQDLTTCYISNNCSKAEQSFRDIDGCRRTHYKNYSNDLERNETRLSGSKERNEFSRNNDVKYEFETYEIPPDFSQNGICTICKEPFTDEVPNWFHKTYCEAFSICKICSQVFPDVSEWKTHTESEHATLPCTLGCSAKIYQSETALKNHYKSFHDITNCDFCNIFVSAREGVLHQHYSDHHRVTEIQELATNRFVLYDENNDRLTCWLCNTDLTRPRRNLYWLINHAADHNIPSKNALILLETIPVEFRRRMIMNMITNNSSVETQSTHNAVQCTVRSVCETEIIDSEYTLENNTDHDEIHIISEHSETSYSEQSLDSKDNTINSNDSSVKTCIFDSNGAIPIMSNGILPESERHSIIFEGKFENLQKSSSDEGNQRSIDDLEYLGGYRDADPNLVECFLTDESDNQVDIIIQQETSLVADRNETFCPICKEPFIDLHSRRRLLEHMKSIHDIDILNKKYSCPNCNKIFYTYMAFKFHKNDNIIKTTCNDSFDSEDIEKSSAIKDQHHDASVKCHICYERFESMICLNSHWKANHRDEISEEDCDCMFYKCKECVVAFPSWGVLREHFLKKKSVIFRCSLCHVVLRNKKSLKPHYRNVHNNRNEGPQACEECGEELVNHKALKAHIRQKHDFVNKQGFQCRLCKEKFDTEEIRKLHYEKNHSGESPYLCVDCGRGFSSRSGLYGHRQQHKTNQPSTCQYCGKTFSRRDSYHEHVLIHIGPRHRCPHCPKEFVQRSNLVRHIRIHTGQKPYACTFCEKRFSDKGACTSHIRVHTKEEQCTCPYCGQTFTKKQKLKYHIRKHTGEGLVSCEVCTKTFTNAFALKEHRAIHDRQTRTICIDCGKAFNSIKYLQRHISIVHRDPGITTMEFHCPLCNKTFFKQSKLKSHLMTHAQKNHLKCVICGKQYSLMKSMRNHLQRCHDLQADQQAFKQSVCSIRDNGSSMSASKPIDNLLSNEKNWAEFNSDKEYYSVTSKIDKISDRFQGVQNYSSKQTNDDTVLNLTNQIRTKRFINLPISADEKIISESLLKSESVRETRESAAIIGNRNMDYSIRGKSKRSGSLQVSKIVLKNPNCETALNLIKQQIYPKFTIESLRVGSTADFYESKMHVQEDPDFEKNQSLSKHGNPSNGETSLEHSKSNLSASNNRNANSTVLSSNGKNHFAALSEQKGIGYSSPKITKIQRLNLSPFEAIGNHRKHLKKPRKYMSPVDPLAILEDNIKNVVPKKRRVEEITMLIEQTSA